MALFITPSVRLYRRDRTRNGAAKENDKEKILETVRKLAKEISPILGNSKISKK